MIKILNKKSKLQKSFLLVILSLFVITGFICDKTVSVSPPLKPVSTGISINKINS